MTPSELTCAQVDEHDMDVRYLAERLTEAEAEAFERHYFGCERCWALVHAALEVRAAGPLPEDSTPVAPPLRPGARARARPVRAWWPLAAAAGVAVLGVALARFAGSRGPLVTRSTARGRADSIAVRVVPGAHAFAAQWARVPGADEYLVRLVDARGRLRFEATIPDTGVSVPAEGVRLGSPAEHAGSVYWDIVALDSLRHVIARSGAVRAPSGGAAAPPLR